MNISSQFPQWIVEDVFVVWGWFLGCWAVGCVCGPLSGCYCCWAFELLLIVVGLLSHWLCCCWYIGVVTATGWVVVSCWCSRLPSPSIFDCSVQWAYCWTAYFVCGDELHCCPVMVVVQILYSSGDDKRAHPKGMAFALEESRVFVNCSHSQVWCSWCCLCSFELQLLVVLLVGT